MRSNVLDVLRYHRKVRTGTVLDVSQGVCCPISIRADGWLVVGRFFTYSKACVPS